VAAAPKPTFDPGSGTPTSEILTRTEPALSDAQVIAVLLAVNQGEIQMADLAIRNATGNEVKQFAAMMKTMHSAGLQRTKSTESRTRISQVGSEVSQYLDNEVAVAIKDLRGRSGASFDRAYMDVQVRAHTDVLAAIDHRLTPSATNGEVRTLVAETRQAVVGHLTKAQQIDERLSPASSAPMSNRVSAPNSLARSR
jgi:putative membrane protein